MLWEIEIRPKGAGRRAARVAEEYDLLTHGKDGAGRGERRRPAAGCWKAR